MNPSNSSKESRLPSSAWPESPARRSAKKNPPFSPRQRTRKRSENVSISGKRFKANSREEFLLLQYDIDPEVFGRTPKVFNRLRRNKVSNELLIETLRGDDDPDSIKFIVTWDSLSQVARKNLGIDAIAVAAGLTPRRLWEVFNGATMMQSREAVGLKIAMSLPAVFDVTIKNALKAKGIDDREHLYKVSGSLPTPKGATTNINVGQPKPAELTDGDETKGDLEAADDFMLSASKVMNAKQLPAPKDNIPDAEFEEPEEDEEADEDEDVR